LADNPIGSKLKNLLLRISSFGIALAQPALLNQN
jgi:hypothetical protein